MSKIKTTIIVSALILAFLALAVWLYDENSKVQQEEPSLPEASIESGVALFNEKRYSEAIEIFENVQPGHPQEWYSLYYLGSAYIMQKNYPAAAEHLELALSLNPGNTKIMHALGVTYFKLGNLKLSKAYFASVLEIDPQDAEARGLMDIMANLERQQAGASQDESPDNNQ
jgi:tetratricopeptide (TPR) repeat protein